MLSVRATSLPCLLGLLLSLAAIPARAQQPPPSKEHVRALLSGYEYVPGQSTFRALGPGTLDVLIALYDDPTEPWYVRMRAVGATRYYPSSRTRKFLLRVANDPNASALFTRQAVLSLGRAFGPKARKDLAPFLRHPDPVVRRAAAQALIATGDPDARAAVRKRLAREHDPVVVRTIERLLRR